MFLRQRVENEMFNLAKMIAKYSQINNCDRRLFKSEHASIAQNYLEQAMDCFGQGELQKAKCLCDAGLDEIFKNYPIMGKMRVVQKGWWSCKEWNLVEFYKTGLEKAT